MESLDQCIKELEMKTKSLSTRRFVFGIGMADGTWKTESVESLNVTEAQFKIYNMYPSEANPDILFRVFIRSEDEAA